MLGHTHVAAVERFERGWAGTDRGLVCNPGSVGQPRDGDPDAAYATLTLGPDPDATLHRVPYDVDRTVRAVEAAGLPAAAGERLRKGV